MSEEKLLEILSNYIKEFSYQLHMTGEKYWTEFSKYFSKIQKIEAFPNFLKKYNKRILNAKLKRLEKILNCIKDKKLYPYCNDIISLINNLSSCLKQKKDAKTIVFTGKMLLYGCRIISGTNISTPPSLFIPLDSRMQKISKNKKFWEELSENTNIPLLHIDSLLWITMGKNEQEINKLGNPLREKIRNLKIFLQELND